MLRRRGSPPRAAAQSLRNGWLPPPLKLHSAFQHSHCRCHHGRWLPEVPAAPSPPPARNRPPPFSPPAAAGPASTASHSATAVAATRPTLGAAEAAGAGCDGRVWASVKPLLDEVWYLDTPPPVALRRVAGRHRRVAGLSRPAAAARVAANDARNAAMVSRGRGRADVVWTPGQGVTELRQPGELGA